MLNQELIDWLRLVLTPEIGSRRGKSLLERFKTPKGVLEASLDDLAEVENIGRVVAEKIVAGKEKVDLDRQIKAIEKNNVTLIPLDSEFYPESLKSIYDPPLVLFVQGEILPQDYFSIAIVGTRLASFYGRSMSEKISAQLVEKGFSIVSGGAAGIDTFSHQAVLKMKGRTLAVLGCGLDVAYPPENKKLFEKISQNGAMVSEFPLFTKPERGNFPMRNRIISGLSLGVVVIEAPRKSGALITVTHANEQGREVFSVPGQADSAVSKGSNQLIREGAKLVESADDIIEELEPMLKCRIKEFKSSFENSCVIARSPDVTSGRRSNLNLDPRFRGDDASRQVACLPARQASQEPLAMTPAQLTLSEGEGNLYNCITDTAIGLDELIERTHFTAGQAADLILRLRLKKLIRELPGKYYMRGDTPR